jgi:hypothetical protein
MAMSSQQARETSREPVVSLVAENLHSVAADHEIIGFIRTIGTIYVALSGGAAGHAVEVGQTMNWNQAVDLVVDSTR